MPFTPFHWGPALLIGLVLFPILDVPTLLVASVIVDIEPLVLLIQGAPILHGFFHTHLGASIAALGVTPFMWLLRKPLEKLMGLFGLPRAMTLQKTIMTSLLGANFHILLDAFLYPEMHPFWPLLGNPFLGLMTTSGVYLFCIICFIAAIPLYIFQVWRQRPI